MTWRVATSPKTALLEVIDQQEWNQFTKERQAAYQAVSLFASEERAG